MSCNKESSKNDKKVSKISTKKSVKKWEKLVLREKKAKQTKK